MDFSINLEKTKNILGTLLDLEFSPYKGMWISKQSKINILKNRRNSLSLAREQLDFFFNPNKEDNTLTEMVGFFYKKHGNKLRLQNRYNLLEKIKILNITHHYEDDNRILNNKNYNGSTYHLVFSKIFIALEEIINAIDVNYNLPNSKHKKKRMLLALTFHDKKNALNLLNAEAPSQYEHWIASDKDFAKKTEQLQNGNDELSNLLNKILEKSKRKNIEQHLENFDLMVQISYSRHPSIPSFLLLTIRNKLLKIKRILILEKKNKLECEKCNSNFRKAYNNSIEEDFTELETSHKLPLQISPSSTKSSIKFRCHKCLNEEDIWNSDYLNKNTLKQLTLYQKDE
ncbi:MAG: hypothetical protein H8E12_11130 [Rhodobacteraceae bacterium]|nr:hypothetical protein [Paracoccaceae bacterium]